MANDVRGLGAAQYQAAKRRLLSGAADAAPAQPATLADKPDAECIDVRGLSDQGYRAAKAGLLQRANHMAPSDPRTHSPKETP